MTNLYEYLRHLSEPVPSWLARFEPGDRFDCRSFFASRVVYYPGARTDGHPVKLFGSTHSAHCFVYADYGIAQSDIEAELTHPTHSFFGYHTLSRVQLSERDLAPPGRTSGLNAGDVVRASAPVHTSPFGFVEILQRDNDRGDDHGAGRLAVLFLGADGIASYDALFCQGRAAKPPFAVIVQDHFGGGNYDRFGRNGLLEQTARRRNSLPQWLLVGDDTLPWEGYVRVPGVEGDAGGMHRTPRFLHQCAERLSSGSRF